VRTSSRDDHSFAHLLSVTERLNTFFFFQELQEIIVKIKYLTVNRIQVVFSVLLEVFV